jgi:hypothetical protein
MLKDQDMEANTVIRDARGRVTKGSKLSPYGSMPRRQIMAVKRLEGLTEKAIKTLERLLDDPNGSVALGSAKEVLDRNLGKVKQNVTVDVTSTHVLHLEALQFLAQKKRDQLQVIDNTANTVSYSSNATLDRIGSHEHETLALSADDYSVSMGDAEPPRPPDDRGAAAYAPPPPATPQNPSTPQDDTP